MNSVTGKVSRRNFLAMAAGTGATVATGTYAAAALSYPEQEPFSYAVIADPHCAEPAKKGLEKFGNAVNKLMHCFETMTALPKAEQPDFVLIAGDIHPDALAPQLDRISFPLHVVAGNHEGSRATRNTLRKLFPGDFGSGDTLQDYYSFVHKGVRFIALCDAGAGGEHVGQFSSELITPFGQCDWFEKQLAAPEKRKVVFAHIPPALDGGDRNMYMSRNDSRWFVKTVTHMPPEMLFFGHLHQGTARYDIGTAQAINLRSCCWNFREAPLGFMLVNVTDKGMKTREIITGEYA